MPVYIIEAADSARLKIGYTAGDPRKRLAALVTGTPERLRLVAVVAGDQENERQLHRHFATVRQHNEWFEPSDELSALVEAHRYDWKPRESGLVEDLARALGCRSRRDLAELMCTSPPRVSGWDTDGMPAWAVLVAMELLSAAGKAIPATLDAERRRIVAKHFSGSA